MFSESHLIAYGPERVHGVDGDNNLIIACISNYHCTVMVDYAWFRDGLSVKTGRKASFIVAHEPGSYHCVVKVNGNEEISETVKVVNVAGPTLKSRKQPQCNLEKESSGNLTLSNLKNK